MRRLSGSGLTQQQLADFVGVDRATVSQWATGKRLPHLDPLLMARLCVALGCSNIFELAKIFESSAPSGFELGQEFARLKISLEKGENGG